MAGAAGVAGTAGSGGGMAGSAGTGGAAGATGGAGGSGGTGGAGGNPGGVGATCTANDGCRQGLYCKKSGCGPVDLLGKCADRPNSCDFDDNPICGCDGFTYLNSCLAEMNGQNVATQPGICKDGVAIKCTPGSQACAGRPNAVCGILVADHSACSSANPPGKCWVIPDECVPTGTHYDSCTGGDHCVHTCDVVKQQKPYYPALDPACMP